MTSEKHLITLCLGSSCFVNGSSMILEHVKEFIAARNLNNVELKGSLCQGHCKDGPSITVDGNLYTKLTITKLQSILESHLISLGKIE